MLYFVCTLLLLCYYDVLSVGSGIWCVVLICCCGVMSLCALCCVVVACTLLCCDRCSIVAMLRNCLVVEYCMVLFVVLWLAVLFCCNVTYFIVWFCDVLFRNPPCRI